MRKPILTTLLLALPTLTFAQNIPTWEDLRPAVDSAANSLRDTNLTPGVLIVISRTGQPAFASAYGTTDTARLIPPTPVTPYRVGSVTKQFTAALILRLADKNKLSLDDPLSKHLPDYPTHGKSPTLRHLLTHTSGLANFDLSADNAEFFAAPRSYDDFKARFGPRPLEFNPGEKFSYNNTGFYLLGEVAARITGKPFPEALHDDLLKPLSLTRTYINPPRTPPEPDPIDGNPKPANGYIRKGDKFIPAAPIHLPNLGGAGALTSTAADLLEWTRLLHSGKVVSPASYKEMTTPAKLNNGEPTNYGLGLFVDSLESHPKLFHGGRGAGFLSLLSHYPKDNLTIVLFMNADTDRAARDNAEATLARAALAISSKDLPLTPQQAARYAGKYSLTLGNQNATLTVTPEGTALRAQLGSAKPTTLRHQGNHIFLHGENPNIRLTFSPPNSLTLTQNNQVIPGTRIQ